MVDSPVAIIDSGGANIASLRFALQRLDADSVLTTNTNVIRRAKHVILPGVGAAASAMHKLQKTGLDEVIPKLQQPVLGICLGMQLLADGSDENDANCLNIFAGSATKLPGSVSHPVPNMGWCPLKILQSNPLLSGIYDGAHFYFLHSYALPVRGSTLASATHMGDFAAVIAERNFYATQFHPERSGSAGSRLLKNFLEIGQ